jgi:hypothetical protein
MKTSKRLAGPAQVSNSAATKYTVPGATITIVRHIHVSNPAGGSAATFTLSIGADAAGTRVIGAESIPTGESRDYWGPYTLVAAEVIQALSGTNNVLTLTIDGEEITLG